ncbi:replication protein [Legionella gresilensis]|uniref:replication protein n=1 Tax=Legionella gresilensis TaxID=91823 RepID=UPI001041AC44|nr:replication protein [Legionella gresilensis]
MSVLRIHKKNQNFVILDKTCLQDNHLSWGAKGLHAYLMSLPDDWRVRVSDLQTRATNGRDSVRSLLMELGQAGYISKSACRNTTSGKFEGLEYVVYEVPQPKNDVETPEPENTFLAINLSPENPAPGNPTSANPPLLSNKNNNNLLTKKAAASNEQTREASLKHEKAAAAFSDKNKSNLNREKNEFVLRAISNLSPEDSLIGNTLTDNQLQRIKGFVQKLNIGHTKLLIEEVTYCLLSAKHFTVCGKDFSRKLNAIRAVILRGDWQRPAELVIKVHDKTNVALGHLEKELNELRSEALHFQRLLSDVKLPAITRGQFEAILTKAQVKMSLLEKEIQSTSAISEVRAS